MDTDQLTRIEGKLDELKAFFLEILTWKSELEEQLASFQNGNPMFAAIAKMFGNSTKR